MLEINYYANKEVLVIELSGVLLKSNFIKYKKEILTMIKELEIKQIKIDISNLIKIDIYGLKVILRTYGMVLNQQK